MKRFYEKVDLRSRKAMVDFLENHFRYFTMNSWNRSTSFANNMKIYNLGLSKEIEDTLYDILFSDDNNDLDFYIKCLIADFETEHDDRYTACFNGRSGGYLVLYKMELVPNEYKSHCTNCGQQNYASIEETGCKCGRCGQDTRVDYSKPLMKQVIYPGRSIGDEDFNDKEDWDMNSLREMVKLVQDFDTLCEDIVYECNHYAENHKVVEEEILVPKKVKRVVEKV